MDDQRHGDTNDLQRRVKKMRAAGRITDAEAAEVRAAVESGRAVDFAVGDIRRRHAREWIAAAVERGRLTEAAATAAVAAVERGEDPRDSLRQRERGGA